MKEDRRIARTRQLLHETLFALASEYGYDTVTVQDVLDRAGVARSTFYAHFRDKDDLLLSGFQRMRESLPGNLLSTSSKHGADHPGFGLSLFEHVGENRELAKVFMTGDAGRLVSGHLRNLLVIDTRAWVRQQAGAIGVAEDLVVQYMVSALFGLLTWWVEHDFPYSPQEMGAAYRRMVSPGLSMSAISSSPQSMQ
jgi:AcrR family transcriptional regulator